MSVSKVGPVGTRYRYPGSCCAGDWLEHWPRPSPTLWMWPGESIRSSVMDLERFLSDPTLKTSVADPDPVDP
jgi:hypothetical protein